MKRFFVIYLLIMVAAAVFEANAQKTPETFNQETLERLIKTASKKLENEKYRLTTGSQSFRSGNSVSNYTQKTVTEVIPPDRRHYYQETLTNGNTSSYETITVGENFFYRFNGGEWKTGGFGSGTGIGSGSGTGVEKRITIENRTDRNFIRNVTVNGQTADLFEIINTLKYTFRSNTYSVITKSTYWFDREGRFIKTVYDYENTELGIISNSTKDYEYDIDIKIEMPLVLKTN